jgi:hypothetical protein
MAFSIEEIKREFNFQGARPTLFEVSVTFNDAGIQTFLDNLKFVASSTSIPESRLGNIAVPYFGRVVNFAGDRVYDPWAVTVMNDEEFKIRNALEAWSNLINQSEANIRRKIDYKAVATVKQYSKTGEIVRTYTLSGIYPSVISPIRLDWGLQNEFERFDVQFIYDYWTVEGKTVDKWSGK